MDYQFYPFFYSPPATMQVRAIVLYNYEGEKRILPFKLGRVNIITGESETGKSSIINVLDYCLGRSDFKMFKGVNMGVVAWYGVVLQVGWTQVFIAKPPPKENGDSQLEAYLAEDTFIQLPTLKELRPNSTDKAVTQTLSSLLKITENRALSPSGPNQEPKQATVQHAKAFLFQEQGLVANKNHLFWRQDDKGYERHLRDSLFYFLGAVQDEQWTKKQELERYQARMRQLLSQSRNLNRQQAQRNQGFRTLLLQAQQLEMIASAAAVPDESLLPVLQSFLTWQFSTSPAVAIQNSPLEREREQAQEIGRDFRDKLREIEEIERYQRQANEYSSAAHEHADRLQAVRVFGHEAAHGTQCPLCEAELDVPPPSVAALTTALARMEASLQGVQRERPQLEQHLNELRNQLEDVRTNRRLAEQRVVDLNRAQTASAVLRDREIEVSRLVGRTEEHLRSLQLLEDGDAIRASIKKGEQLIQELEEEIASMEVIPQVESALSVVASYMTQWASELQMGHRGHPHRLDYRLMTVVADNRGRIPMDVMGGGSNALGCHLICLMALHRYFIENERPVPGLLVLDQPSQVYFPSLQGQRNLVTVEDMRAAGAGADEAAVLRFFEFLFKRVQELSPNIQLIVTEHANLDMPEFQAALVEEPWVNGKALIPVDWLNT
ncbi:DUF3732 domain-containing protein [Hymenobacter negativus]|uniref:DUF3732 domain-containing protein n=1 Tax=Hymenobacter negativus TaxID=2795026 RepID=A0ABS3Q8L7_9BACT|nr:DUF3732 domain-containing protein [Hymenobacter negativus]MBO2007588.1 DUF3732 domain-containing protein [Hymenobacter negativus]